MALARTRRKTGTLRSRSAPLLVVSTGCPAGIGPEVSVAAAAVFDAAPCVLVGDTGVIERAAELRGVDRRRLVAFQGEAPGPYEIAVLASGPKLTARDITPGKPSKAAGAAELQYIEDAYALTRAGVRRGLVTGPVSKAAIAHSGLRRARGFLGHTEWLGELDGAPSTVMCFAGDRLVTSLVTTHLPITQVPRALTPKGVQIATVELVHLLHALGHRVPHIAVASLNPHAGESELLGGEERRAILPGIEAARKELKASARIEGPIGAETAYRKAHAGTYDGVVAMYHDQATIPMKLVAFGDAVNVTMGLSIVRTSVDHGTAYDIAWRGIADPEGMLAALRLASRLSSARSRESSPKRK